MGKITDLVHARLSSMAFYLHDATKENIVPDVSKKSKHVKWEKRGTIVNSCQILFFSLRKIFCSFITNVVPTKSLSSYHRASVYGKLHPATRGYLLFPPPRLSVIRMVPFNIEEESAWLIYLNCWLRQPIRCTF